MKQMERIDAEPERAVYALSVAADLLGNAREKAASMDFENAVAFSRDSMRLSSSAILTTSNIP